MDEQLIRSIVDQVLNKLQNKPVITLEPDKIPIAVSARHVHLSEEHVTALFGEMYELTPKAPLSQPGQFAAKEQVTIVGPKSSIHHVRVLGPARALTQVEISATDARALGIQAPLRYSGDIHRSAPVTIVGPKGSIYLREGCIIAAAHIHMSEIDAKAFHVIDGQLVNVRTNSGRSLIFSNVKVRVSERFQLEMHVDTDEGNAAMIEQGTVGEIVGNQSVGTLPVPPQVLLPKRQVIDKKLLTEKDIGAWQGEEIVIAPKTIVTALANDKARQRGIKIVRQ